TVALVFALGNYLLTPLIFIALYNLPHLYFRFAGIFWGYREGTHVIRSLRQFQFPQIRQTLRLGTMVLLAYLIPNHVNVHTPFLLTNLPLEYFYFGEKVVQGFGALLLVTLGTFAYRARVDVLLISFLLMIFALVLYHWGILI
ncbi:MAG TPA: PTS system mannose/fructose/sorbose family transporter subunit IID, partial [Candidatus Rifleibacterium sp.]|nr:PTS system mannose/fructose/sorbose family transporter subunit IID [Candidatus Rifleibacterium sp.]